jgi:hypothetical protein
MKIKIVLAIAGDFEPSQAVAERLRFFHELKRYFALRPAHKDQDVRVRGIDVLKIELLYIFKID